MPKSKRNKIVHLTQVKKKGKDHKEDLIKQLEQYIAKFKMVYIFDFDGAKSDRIMNLRLKLKDLGKIFAGRNSLVSVTLRTIGAKTNTDFEELASQIVGHRGLLFADIECDKLVDLLDKETPEFCKKLLGYSQIAPHTELVTEMSVDETVAGDNDDDDDDDDEQQSSDAASAKKKKSAKKASKTKKNKKKRGSTNTKREVKFVKI